MLGFSGILLGDIVLEIISASSLTILALDILLSILTTRSCSVSTPAPGEERIWLWERREIRLSISRCRGFQGFETPEWLSQRFFKSLGNGSFDVVFETSFRSYGIYRLEWVEARFSGPFGLAMTSTRYRLGVIYRVLPEASYWVLEGLRILGIGGGGYTHGFSGSPFESPPVTRGSGEYRWSREYTRGDSASRIDWRATSRILRLVVREYGESWGGGLFFMVDYRCFGRASCDALASSMVSTAIYAALSSTPVRYIYERGFSRLVPVGDAKAMLAYFIDRVFELGIIEASEILPHEYVAPMDIDSIRAILSEVAGIDGHGSGLPSIYGYGLETVLEKAGGFSVAVIITCLSHDVDYIVDSIAMFRRKGYRVLLITPEKPWIDMGDLEDAYRVYNTHSLAVERARELGAEVILWRSSMGGE